ncbi:rhodanese-like domain-containing protein [Brevibacillus composti]|uniref:Rhodanese-like domain-containing protein n=1 Tax=Brevibacillus composti TaxID=2796470 RepID=A0A7T5EJW2_9BACL|nr:rhodanese-like domain-containing protein [Brevibacillus composti]QQE73990.1 rhodanese-like domain-containing protein [Brevibacillus composti]QUO41074.1 rhodanese-like domain-containing protein [Brevibacillus composti]
MDYIFYIVLALFVIWMLYKQFAPVKGVRNLSAKQFQEESKGNKVIDVREVHEYKRGHIAGAVNIPLSQLSQRMGEIPKDKKVFLYCQSGMRSKQAAKLLSRNGYTNLANLNGGISAWSGPIQQ